MSSDENQEEQLTPEQKRIVDASYDLAKEIELVLQAGIMDRGVPAEYALKGLIALCVSICIQCTDAIERDDPVAAAVEKFLDEFATATAAPGFRILMEESVEAVRKDSSSTSE